MAVLHVSNKIVLFGLLFVFFILQTTVYISFHKLGLFNRENIDTYLYEKK